MKHLYPVNRKETFYYKHAEPVLKVVAVSAMLGFLTLLCLSFAGKI
jgi:hypothetical protein